MKRTFTEIDNFQYLPCLNPQHQSQPLSTVCTDIHCQRRTMLCIYCQQQQHHDHRTIPIKNYLKKAFTTVYGQMESNNVLHLINTMEEIQQNYLVQFQQLKSTFCEMVDQTITSARLHFSRIQTEMMRLYNSKKNLQTVIDMHFHQNINNVKKITQIMESFLVNGFYEEQSDIIKIYSKMEYLLEDFKKKYSENQLKIKKLNQHFLSQFKDMQVDFQTPVNTYSPVIKFKWSTQLKGTNMMINGQRIQRSYMSSNQRFGLFSTTLKPFMDNKRKVDWFLKISKLSSWIGIGIALKNVMALKNYNFYYTSLGHGSYLISSNGYSWSHSIQGDNSVYKSFQFTTNDVIRMELDPMAGQLNFYQLGKNVPTIKKKNINAIKKFTLKIEKNISPDEYYPCVNLCATGDAVEIVTQ